MFGFSKKKNFDVSIKTTGQWDGFVEYQFDDEEKRKFVSEHDYNMVSNGEMREGMFLQMRLKDGAGIVIEIKK